MHGTEFGGILMRRGWLSRLPADVGEAFRAVSRIQRYPAGATIFAAGDEPGGIHGIAFGVVALVYPDRATDMTLVHLTQPGTWLGQVSLLTDEPRRVSAIARTDSATLSLPLTPIRALLDENPGWWRYIALISVENLDLAIGGAEDLMLRDNDQRCIATLLRLCGCRFADPDPALAAAAPVTQDELAAMANMSRNKAGEVLRDLEERGLIALGYRTVTIRNGAALRAMVDAPGG